MTFFPLTHGLHREDQPAAHAAKHTHLGQAHFAGSGPGGRTCRDCAMWSWSPKVQGWAKFTGPKASPCAKYRELMRGWGRSVPHGALACRHFLPRDAEIPLVKPEKVA
jgi:hypothetical protein